LPNGLGGFKEEGGAKKQISPEQDEEEKGYM
jgi:hypothetical protein